MCVCVGGETGNCPFLCSVSIKKSLTDFFSPSLLWLHIQAYHWGRTTRSRSTQPVHGLSKFQSEHSASETVKDWRERAEAGSPALSRREGHSLGLHLLPAECSAIEEACSPICISNSWRVDEAIHSAFCVLVLLGMGCCLAAGHGSLRLPESAGPLTHTAFKTRIDLLREVSDAMVSPRHR